MNKNKALVIIGILESVAPFYFLRGAGRIFEGDKINYENEK